MDTRRIRTVIGGTVKSYDELRATLGVIHVVSSTGVCIMSSFVDRNEQVQMCGRGLSVHGMTHDALGKRKSTLLPLLRPLLQLLHHWP